MEVAMDAIFTDYLRLLEDAQRDRSTLANNRLALRRLSDWLAKRGLEAATASRTEMRAYLQDLLTGYKRSTAEKLDRFARSVAGAAKANRLRHQRRP
jgi:site-specific recombinase XerD